MNRSKVEYARYTYSQHEGSGDEQKYKVEHARYTFSQHEGSGDEQK